MCGHKKYHGQGLRSSGNYQLTGMANINYLKTKEASSEFSVFALLLWVIELAWITRVTVFIRRRAGAEFANVDPYAATQIMIVAALGILIIISPRLKNLIFGLSRTSVIYFLIYYFICTLSALWSPMPQFTIYRAFEFQILFLGTFLAISYSANLESAEKTVLFVSALVVLLGIIGRMMWQGFSFDLSRLHTNSYTCSAAMLFCYTLGNLFSSTGRRRRLLGFYCLCGLAGIVIGTSSASIISMLFGVSLIFLLVGKFIYFLMTAWLLLIVFALVFVADVDFSFMLSILFPGKSTEKIMSASSRIPMWEGLFYHFLKSPLIGYGYALFTTGHSVMKSNPHNSFFSIILGTGLLGLFPVSLMFFRLTMEFIQTTRRRLKGSIGLTAALAAGIIISLSNPYIFDQWEESSFVFCCFFALFILHVLQPYRQKIRPERKQYV